MIPCTTSRVDASCFSSTTTMTACLPSTSTAFCLHPAQVEYRADVTQMNERVAFALDRNFSKSSIFIGEAFVRTIQSVCLILMSPPGSTSIAAGHSFVNIRRRDVTGEQVLLIEVDHDLHVLAPIGMRHDRAGTVTSRGRIRMMERL